MSSFLRPFLPLILIMLIANCCTLSTSETAIVPCIQSPFVEHIEDVSGNGNLEIGYTFEKSFYITSVDGKNNLMMAKGIFPYWSPDRKKVAYLEANEICIANSDGSHILQITNDALIKSDISWSPSGKYIVFVVNLKDEKDLLGSYYNGEIYTATITGEVTRLTYSAASTDNHPSWSPDEKMVAFESYSDPVDTGGYIEYTVSISVLNVLHNQSFVITTNGHHPIWFPDGKHLLFESLDGQLCKIDLEGQNRSCITSGYRDYAPQFSPDGKSIAFTRIDKDWLIYIMNPDGSNLTRLANGIYPKWSPDGGRIAFGTGGEHPDLYVINADSTNPTLVAKDAWGYTWIQP